MSYAAAIGYLADILRQIRKINRGEMQAVTAESAKTTDSSNNPLADADGKHSAADAVNYTVSAQDGAADGGDDAGRD